jgi:hypothetical protein
VLASGEVREQRGQVLEPGGLVCHQLRVGEDRHLHAEAVP